MLLQCNGQFADIHPVSHMAAEKPKRDIADFFRPYAKPQPSKSIPAKRPSPTPAEDLDERTGIADKLLKRTVPQTPGPTTRVKDGVFSPYKSPFGPRSGASVTIAIRSPKPTPSHTPVTVFSPASEALRKGGLFASASKKKDQEEKPLSFADIPTSGQTIRKDGKVIAVRNSDDEDSDSLCSLDDILGRNRRDVPTESSSPPDVDEEDLEAQRERSLSAFTHGRSNALIGRDKLRELTSKANRFNFDISSIVGDHFDDEETEANVAKAKQGYKGSDDREQRKGQTLDKNLLASVVGQEEGRDHLQRLFDAVERTEALTTDLTWSMFTSGPVSIDSCPQSPFPEDAMEPDSWCECLKDPTVRTRAYLTGYVAETASEGGMPNDLITWTLNRIIKEPRQDLRDSYVRVVRAASWLWTSTNLTPNLIEELFCQLGADLTMVKCANRITPEPKIPVDHSATRITGLSSMIEALSCLVSDMSSETLSKFVKLLMRLAIDTSLMANSHMCVAVEDTISRLLDHPKEQVSISVAKCILNDIGANVKDPFLQTQTFKHILPTSSFAGIVRIQLAILFLLDEEMTDMTNLDLSNTHISFEQLTSHLNDPRYDISHSSRQVAGYDYSTLSSLLYTFDVALANGGRPSVFPDASSEREFNHKVDVLADRIKSIMVSITDTGASHMRRTEAKEAINALHFRLLYGVRTKPRPKKSVFGGRDGSEYRSEERSAGMMQQFLDRQRKHKAQKEKRVKLADTRDQGSLSQKSESSLLIGKQLGLES